MDALADKIKAAEDYLGDFLKNVFVNYWAKIDDISQYSKLCNAIVALVIGSPSPPGIEPLVMDTIQGF